VDLDKYERQLTSYGLSGDPSVLLTLGNRIIRELSAHLDAEDAFAAGIPGGPCAGSHRAA